MMLSLDGRAHRVGVAQIGFDDADAGRLARPNRVNVAIEPARRNGDVRPLLCERPCNVLTDEAKAADDEGAAIAIAGHAAFLATHRQCRCASDSSRESDSM